MKSEIAFQTIHTRSGFSDVKTSLAELFSQKCPQKMLRFFWKKSFKKMKNVLKTLDG